MRPLPVLRRYPSSPSASPCSRLRARLPPPPSRPGHESHDRVDKRSDTRRVPHRAEWHDALRAHSGHADASTCAGTCATNGRLSRGNGRDHHRPQRSHGGLARSPAPTARFRSPTTTCRSTTTQRLRGRRYEGPGQEQHMVRRPLSGSVGTMSPAASAAATPAASASSASGY